MDNSDKIADQLAISKRAFLIETELQIRADIDPCGTPPARSCGTGQWPLDEVQ